MANEEDDAASEASEWEARERAERDWERMEKEEDRLGAEFQVFFTLSLIFFISFVITILVALGD